MMTAVYTKFLDSGHCQHLSYFSYSIILLRRDFSSFLAHMVYRSSKIFRGPPPGWLCPRSCHVSSLFYSPFCIWAFFLF